MVKKLAIDWDESELRLVAAQCSGSNVKVTDARVIPIEDNVLQTLKAVLDGQGMENTEALVYILVLYVPYKWTLGRTNRLK